MGDEKMKFPLKTRQDFAGEAPKPEAERKWTKMDSHYDKKHADGEKPRRKSMDLINFIVWLSAGAMIGWFARQMVTVQHELWTGKPTYSKPLISEKS